MNKKMLLEIKNMIAKSFSKERLEDNTQAGHKGKKKKSEKDTNKQLRTAYIWRTQHSKRREGKNEEEIKEM